MHAFPPTLLLSLIEWNLCKLRMRKKFSLKVFTFFGGGNLEALTITKRLAPKTYEMRMSGTTMTKPKLVPTPKKSCTPKVSRSPSFP